MEDIDSWTCNEETRYISLIPLPSRASCLSSRTCIHRFIRRLTSGWRDELYSIFSLISMLLDMHGHRTNEASMGLKSLIHPYHQMGWMSAYPDLPFERKIDEFRFINQWIRSYLVKRTSGIHQFVVDQVDRDHLSLGCTTWSSNRRTWLKLLCKHLSFSTSINAVVQVFMLVYFPVQIVKTQCQLLCPWVGRGHLRFFGDPILTPQST